MAIQPNEQARQIRDNYSGMHGDSAFSSGPDFGGTLGAYQSIVSQRYVSGPQVDPDAIVSYREFARECLAQFRVMIECGIRVEFFDDDPTPMATKSDGTQYPSIKKLFEEYESTGILRVYRSVDGFHALLDQHTIMYNGREENANSIFRAVHDYFGHFASGGYFNWHGETCAYYSHARMFSAKARTALFCETVAQQCVYAATGDYAEQKCVSISNTYHNPLLA